VSSDWLPKIVAVALAVVLGNMVVLAKNSPQQGQSQSVSTEGIATAICNDTFESTGVGNSTSVKGAAEELKNSHSRERRCCVQQNALPR